MIRLPLLILYVFLLSFLQALANPIKEVDALQLATKFNQQRNPSMLRSTASLKLVFQGIETSLRSASDPTYYIYNIGEQQGFVIVSGEDATKTILGYADEGAFETANMPQNVQSWLNFYRQEIEAVRAAAVAPTSSIPELVSTIAAGSTTVAPLLGGIKWNQTSPYNNLCPVSVGSSTHALAGCVAIAMSQIMKFHQWPVTGTGIHKYTDTNYGEQSVDFSKTTYNWTNMLDVYDSNASDVEKSAVATLIYQCGVAVSMKYSLTGSSSNIANASEAFVNHFGYDSEIQRYERPYYTVDEWTNIIKAELDRARPVYYSGSSDAGGHAFVCDGYDSNNLFHINWGWGGQSNGYFELSSLSSDYPGVVGAAPEFADQQSILTGIRKANDINQATNQVMVYGTGLNSSKSSVPNISNSTFTLNYNFINYGTNSVNIRWGIGYMKEGSNTMIKLAESSSYVSFAPSSYTPQIKSFAITAPIDFSTAGTYRLYPIYLPKGSTNWSIIRGSPVLNNCMIVTVASNNGPATILPALTSPSLTLTKTPEPITRFYKNKVINVDVTIQNTGKEYYSKVGLCLISTTDPGDRTYICESKVLCPAGETKTFHLSGTVTSLPGNYYLQAQFDSTNSNSTVNYKVFGPSINNSSVVEVLPTPGTPVLQLNNTISLANGLSFSSNDTLNLTVSITNTGGLFTSSIKAYVFPKIGSTFLSFLNPKYVSIDSLETQEVTLTGKLDLNEGDYSMIIYQLVNNSWIQLSPYNLSHLNFTLTNTPTKILPKVGNQSIFVQQIADQLFIETAADIRQSTCFDLSGRLVRKSNSEKVLQVGDLKPGVYLLRIQTNEKIYIERFLKH